MVNAKRTFVLGLGHQKCGTSWLYQYLCQSQTFAKGDAKEYHVWDRLDIPLLQHLGGAVRKKMQNNQNFYFDYFSDLMSSGKLLTADITPSYSGLKAQRLNKIKQGFDKRKIEVRPVILVRDPLSRIKSAVRFNLDRRNFSEGIPLNERDFDRALSHYYKTTHCFFRTKYENIIIETLKVFHSDDVYIGFYENMFEANEVIRLSAFLRITPQIEFSNIRVNKTKNPVPETQFDSAIRSYYSETYDYFYKRYPITKNLWK